MFWAGLQAKTPAYTNNKANVRPAKRDPGNAHFINCETYKYLDAKTGPTMQYGNEKIVLRAIRVMVLSVSVANDQDRKGRNLTTDQHGSHYRKDQ
jgi:hypothetical protein